MEVDSAYERSWWGDTAMPGSDPRAHELCGPSETLVRAALGFAEALLASGLSGTKHVA